MSFTVIGYYGKQNKSKCGYCKQSNTSHSHGMHAYVMTVEDYQDLIDRGWRRSGLYCYKPNNKITCCPSYTIKCDTQGFKLSKSHKKILRRMNKFLMDGIKDKCDGDDDDDDDEDDNNGDVGKRQHKNEENSLKIGINEEPDIPNITVRNINVNKIKKLDTNEMKKSNQKRSKDYEKGDTDSANTKLENDDDNENQLEIDQKLTNDDSCMPSTSSSSLSSSKNEIKKGIGPLDSKPPCKKAKQIRLERKKQKLEAKGIKFEEFMKEKNQKKNVDKNNQEKNLSEYIQNVPENSHHKLKVVLIPSNKGVTTDVIDLYRKYQVFIHKDPPQKITKSSFERFLVKSPLQLKLVNVNGNEFKSTLNITYGLYKKYQTIIHNDPPEDVEDYLNFLQKSPLQNKKTEDGPTDGYGSFHQQYWLDNKLIAVGVIDILPYCVSSVYFFYDPDYSFLSLGTYGSLREIDFTRQLSDNLPQLKYYYMGFYIHSCPKMRYKGKLMSSYLLCPEVYTWHLLTDEMKSKLDQNKYQRFNPDPNAKDENEFTMNDINSVLLLINETTYITYGQYRQFSNIESIDQMLEFITRRIYSEVIGGSNETDTIMEYGRLVGKKCAHRMLYYN